MYKLSTRFFVIIADRGRAFREKCAAAGRKKQGQGGADDNGPYVSCRAQVLNLDGYGGQDAKNKNN